MTNSATYIVPMPRQYSVWYMNERRYIAHHLTMEEALKTKTDHECPESKEQQ